MNNTHQNLYCIPFDSSLGVQFNTYIKRCAAANQAAKDFVNTYIAPMFSSIEDAQMIFSDDCEAGGLIAVSLPSSTQMLDVPSSAYIKELGISLALEHEPDQEEEGRTIYFPRIEPHTHYIPYGSAVKKFLAKSKEWDFQQGKPSEVEKGLPLHVYYYCDVCRHLTPGDRALLKDKKSKEPSPSKRLAFGRQFVLNTDYHYNGNQYELAINLYKKWSYLPSVPANTLTRILGLTLPGNISSPSSECTKEQMAEYKQQVVSASYCRWVKDNEKKIYVVQTGLVSHHADMQHTQEDDYLKSLFK